jgi:hypothetical protein
MVYLQLWRKRQWPIVNWQQRFKVVGCLLLIYKLRFVCCLVFIAHGLLPVIPNSIE